MTGGKCLKTLKDTTAPAIIFFRSLPLADKLHVEKLSLISHKNNFT